MYVIVNVDLLGPEYYEKVFRTYPHFCTDVALEPLTRTNVGERLLLHTGGDVPVVNSENIQFVRRDLLREIKHGKWCQFELKNYQYLESDDEEADDIDESEDLILEKKLE